MLVVRKREKTVNQDKMDRKNVLLLGSGGREHAFAVSMIKSPFLEKLFIAPGNGGTSEIATNVDIDINDFNNIKLFVLANNINLVVVGPEEPLVRGIYDFFVSDSDLCSIPVIGPSKEAAKLEGSKQYAKEFMIRHSVPTASYASFTLDTVDKGYDFLDTIKSPYVLKADGLAAGKGVVILDSLKEAKEELLSMLSGKFGDAGKSVVIEQFLSGIEMSVFVLTDGINYKILPGAKDYKRIGEGDTGLNTGGMGAVSPVPFADADFMKKVEERIVIPTVNGIKEDNITYKGFVFIGLMNVGGDPYVIEYNVRMGDPETEVVLPRIESDILILFDAVAKGMLSDVELKISPLCVTAVVCSSCGYPNDYPKGIEIEGLDSSYDSFIYHAGTKIAGDRCFTNGGRVLVVTSMAPTIIEAIAKSYDTISKIHFKGMCYRKDIAQDLI